MAQLICLKFAVSFLDGEIERVQGSTPESRPSYEASLAKEG